MARIKEPNLIIDFEEGEPTREEIINDICLLFEEMSTWNFSEHENNVALAS